MSRYGRGVRRLRCSPDRNSPWNAVAAVRSPTNTVSCAFLRSGPARTSVPHPHSTQEAVTRVIEVLHLLGRRSQGKATIAVGMRRKFAVREIPYREPAARVPSNRSSGLVGRCPGQPRQNTYLGFPCCPFVAVPRAAYPAAGTPAAAGGPVRVRVRSCSFCSTRSAGSATSRSTPR
jgi:hypothetical protein